MNFTDAYQPAYLKFLLQGFLITLEVAALSIVLSFIIGCIVGTVRYSKVPIISRILAFLVEMIRNLPLLLIIFFTRFALPEVGIKISIFWSAVAALTVFESAMIAEIVRGGLRSVDKGQIEAARSSGLSSFQTLWHIVLPQALRRMVPPIVSQFISLVKDTSLAVIISLPELMNQSKIIAAQHFDYTIPALLAAALLYFLTNFTLSRIAKRLEVRIN
ncbi:amino acid ABC transporter permease [Paenibacillus sp. GP183]|uniref:amino acid ABC transporter permease n=1 Tax=Paenibacillus sp. GP183 TaxID=1882751 RepID=UPI00089B5C6D|nr:amino acid ABC transporter permease [Paenibacillus sp. GP183]SEC56519.1 amino acid ABC transporter membrane protein 2, PAAT family [Paenibacillus sp. GP183]